MAGANMRDLALQAARSAAAIPGGTAVWTYLNNPDVVEKLTTAAMGDVPVVKSISADLLREFPQLAHDRILRQRIGLMISAILHARGFEISKRAVRLKDPLFTAGAVYRARRVDHRAAANSPADDFYMRFATALTKAEAESVVRAVLALHPDIKSVLLE
jgi:hypothetical protein